MNIETLRAARIALAKFVREVSPYEGKHWNRQGEKTQREIYEHQQACADAGVSVQFRYYAANMDAPTITCRYAQDMLNNVEEDIHLYDTLSADPRIDEWNEAIEKLADLSRSFREEGRNNVPFDAKRLGLVRGTVNW